VGNRYIQIAIAIFLLVIGLNWFLEQPEQVTVQEESETDEPDLYMVNAVITQFDQTGLIAHKISAERFTHFPLADITTLSVPKIVLFDESNTVPWNIESQLGRILPATSNDKQELLELWDGVSALRISPDSPDYIHIQTASLRVIPEKDYAETDQKVYIDSNTQRTSASAMKAFLKEGRFLFYGEPQERVHTILLPYPKTSS